MAQSVADDTCEVQDVEVTVKRVPELISEEKLEQIAAKQDLSVPIAIPGELAD